MPKLGCPCGFVHNLTPIPDGRWVTIRDSDREDLTPDESTPPDERIERWFQAFFQKAGSLFECPQCGRLMWAKPDEKGYTIYRREQPDNIGCGDPIA